MTESSSPAIKQKYFLEDSLNAGEQTLQNYSGEARKKRGQYLTPVQIARFMAQHLDIKDGDCILEPAMGSGVLVCAIIERLIAQGESLQIQFDCYEVDPNLAEVGRKAIEAAAAEANICGITVKFSVFTEDFIARAAHLFTPEYARQPLHYNHIISNPPYFKISADDWRVKLLAGQLEGTSNIYTLFMGVSAYMLKEGGRGCFIVPRSFCSGSYFSKFRMRFLDLVDIESIHIFDDRDSLFTSGSVLQENVIVTFIKTRKKNSFFEITSSSSLHDLVTPPSHHVSRDLVIERNSGKHFFRLPVDELDVEILEIMDTWPGKLIKFGLKVSTGPVVPFRSRELLMPVAEMQNHKSVPLLWMQNVVPNQIIWPAKNGNGKPQGIQEEAGRQDNLLLPTNNTYVLVRRFSAKEDRRRLIAAALLPGTFEYNYIGFENHLNFIFSPREQLPKNTAIGLAALYNTGLLDRFFRILNGNTQVNAVELQSLPLPPLDVINQIGEQSHDNVSERHTIELLIRANLVPKKFLEQISKWEK